MTAEKSRFVISPEWLAERLDDPDVKVVDASWYLPAQNRDAHGEYAADHIPGAVFFDQDAVVDPDSSLPHALPSPAVFAAHAGRMGLRESDTIVVYDGVGIFTAPRVWWMFKTMGARAVFVLDGGFPAWKDADLPVTDAIAAARPLTFTPSFDAGAVASLEDVRGFVDSGASQIADARGAGRFTGEEPEPREGMRSGHMPGALNVPTFSLSENGRLKDVESLRKTLVGAGVDLDRPVATTCGSGVTAAVITLALNSVGHEDATLYDGSWSEWGGRDDTPVETGPPSTRKP